MFEQAYLRFLGELHSNAADFPSRDALKGLIGGPEATTQSEAAAVEGPITELQLRRADINFRRKK